MVMHARKLPRLSDGYFDRNQAHPYESKYSSKSNLGSRYNDKVRESPSNGSHSRMGSPDNRHSPRYHKSSYRIKDRDKDHERGYVRYVHDSKYKNSSSGSSKSPAYKDRFSKNSSLGGSGGGGGGGGGSSSSSSGAKEPSKPRPVDSTAHRTNHERSQVEPQPQQVPLATENKDRRQQVGDWSEHVSSSGKKYYYNCKTEISQWEKPKEWVDWEKQQPGAGTGVGNCNSSNSSCSSSGSTQRGLATSTPTDPGSGPRPKSRTQDRPPTTVASPAPTTAPPITTSSSVCSRAAAAAASDKHSTGSNSTVSSSSRPYQQARQDVSSSRRSSQPRNVDPRRDAQDMDISPPPGGGGRATPETSRAMLLPPTPAVTLAQLPKMMSQLAGTRGLPKLDDMSPQEAFRTIQQAIQLTKQAQSTGQVEAPPPSYPQHPGRTLPPLQQLEKDGDRRSPGSDYSTHSARRDSPTSSVSSLHSLSGTGSLVSAVLKPTAPSLTPSLANYYNEALISHVTGWQADHAERQANRYSEEAHSLGSLNCTRVSAELKMARSLVRLSEIQATVQEQRSLFLRQLIKELEELKSQVNFMSDS